MGESKPLTLEQYQELRNTVPIGNAVVNLTDQCNLRCKYCFTAPNDSCISLETMKQVVYFLEEEGRRTGKNISKTIAFFGGEPMLRYDKIIKPFLNWCADTGRIGQKDSFRFTMTTNGTLLNEERLDFLFEHDCHLLLSIDGDKFTQNDQRPTATGDGSFDLVYKNIPAILHYYPEITFRSTLEPRNADRVFENYLFARGLGFQSIFICPNQMANWTEKDIIIYLKELSMCVEQMYIDLKTNQHPPLFVSNFCQHARSIFMSDTNEKMEAAREKFGRSILRCGLGTVAMGVGCNGEIMACQEHNTYHDKNDIFYIGNIHTGIDTEKHLNLINKFLEPKGFTCKERPSFCNDCIYKKICGVDFCPSMNMGKNGDILQNSYVHCAESRFSAQLVELLCQMIDAEEDQGVKERLEMIFHTEVIG